ncbi:MAG TPA: hypothetical protein VKT77_08665, partial [Chthonomonadaceae bacterium]|nr:hypothetical protein [Chthonomonadaceae bacterium]
GYVFTIQDPDGDVIWSVRTSGLSATMPPDVPDFELKTPYVWRLTGLADGRPTKKAAWGVVTFLSPQDGEALRTQIDDLKSKLAAAKPGGAASAADDAGLYTGLIVDAYLRFGVLMGALDFTIDDEGRSNILYHSAGPVVFGNWASTSMIAGD